MPWLIQKYKEPLEDNTGFDKFRNRKKMCNVSGKSVPLGKIESKINMINEIMKYLNLGWKYKKKSICYTCVMDAAHIIITITLQSQILKQFIMRIFKIKSLMRSYVHCPIIDYDIRQLSQIMQSLLYCCL